MVTRKYYTEKLLKYKDTDVIKVITGVRRCGKSTIMQQYQNVLQEIGINRSQITYINLEDPKNRNITNWEDLYDYVVSNTSENVKNYIFIDEPQWVEDFERAIDGLNIIDNFDVYITGSNSHLLSGELATLLTGRYVEIKVLPYSFSEFNSAFILNDSDIEVRFSYFLEYGGMPGVVNLLNIDPSLVEDYLTGVFDSVLFKDITRRYETFENQKLRTLVDYMFNNIGSITSPNNVANTLTSNGDKVSRQTVDTYINALVDTKLLYSASRFDIKGKKILQTLEKYYLVDTGFRQITKSRRHGVDTGHALENVVYLELLRRHRKIWVGKTAEYEVDFVCEDLNGNVTYYQVTQTVREESTLKRELRPLYTISDNHPKYLLTRDRDLPETIDGIIKLNVIDWLLKND